MGIYAEYENAIRIMVPRDIHLGDEEFDQLKVGERIRVEIQKSRFQLKDPFIVSVGVYRGRAGAPTRIMPAPVASLVTAVAPPQESSGTPVGGPVAEPVDEPIDEEGAEEEEAEEEEEE
jgi:hypothetical protein